MRKMQAAVSVDKNRRTFYLTPELDDWLCRQAVAEDCSVSKLLTRMLRRARDAQAVNAS